MPFGLKPKCTICKTTSSSMWRKSEDDEVICNSCSVRPLISSNNSNSANGTEPAPKSSNGNAANVCPFTLRKSTRAKSSKLKQQATSKSNNTKGKSRRSIFKKTCYKAPSSVATPVPAQAFFYQGIYYQAGDIVSILGTDDRVYYAQLRGLLQDQYCEKSAVITWLFPTTASPKGRFDPATYVIGYEEETPRSMEFFEFVCHAPSEYYMAKTSPYPVVPIKPESGYVWTRVGPRIVPLPTKEEVFGST